MKASISGAVVENDQRLAEVIRTTIKHDIHVEVNIFSSGEALLKLMESGTRFDIYILDYQLDRYHFVLWGDEITKEVLFYDRAAKIIGISSDSYKDLFTNLGAAFVLKASIKEKLVRAIKELVGKPV